MEEKECKVIKKGIIARALLKRGYQIVDVKPHRKFRGSEVFVFEVVGDFYKDLEEIIKQLNQKRKIKLQEIIKELD